MAIGALENRIIVRIRMACRTDSIGVAMGDREWRVLRVIERRVQPVRGAVAVLASGREKLRLRRMPRIRRVVVVGLVAADASRRQRGVVVVDVAIRAHPRRHGVRSRQRKRRVVVIEGRVRPMDSVMAEFAGGRETAMRHGAGRIVEIRLVARDAERAAELVVIVDVAIRARSRRNGMRSRQRKAGLRMVELSIRPLHRVMALFAGGREPCVRHRTGRIVEIGLVAADACSGQGGVVVVDVAVRAGSRRNGMRSRQRERRVVVIEGRIRPLNRVVAQFAGGREARMWHRTGGISKVLLVASNAERAVQLVVVVDMAIRARSRRNGMRTRQREPGLRMIELGIRPLHCVVTLFAGGRESCVRHRTGRIVEIVLVARNASRIGDGVVVVDVAIGAHSRRNGMGTG